MYTKLISAKSLTALALALGATAIVHLGVWECAADNARQVARDSQPERAAQPAPAVTITALKAAALRHTPAA